MKQLIYVMHFNGQGAPIPDSHLLKARTSVSNTGSALARDRAESRAQFSQCQVARFPLSQK